MLFLLLYSFSNRYDAQLEEMLDEAYERYVIRKGGNTKKQKRAKRDTASNDVDILEVIFHIFLLDVDNNFF